MSSHSNGSPANAGHVGDAQGTSPTAGRGATMQAIVREVYGPASVLQVRDIPTPFPGADEVLVRVHGTGLDRGAWHVMTGRP